MQGQLDSPLTDLGISQAKNAGRFLRSLICDQQTLTVFSSPLGRALHTAKIVCVELGFDAGAIIQEPRLMEANHGSWSGLTRAEAKRNYPKEFYNRKKNHWNFRFPGGESYADLSKRAEAWCSKVSASRNPAIVVTHAMMSRCIRGYYLGLDREGTLQLSHPHNHIFTLEKGKIEDHRLPG